MEDHSTPKVKPPLTGSPEIATEIETSQKEDRIVPFLEEEIAQEYQAAFKEEDENPSSLSFFETFNKSPSDLLTQTTCAPDFDIS